MGGDIYNQTFQKFPIPVNSSKIGWNVSFFPWLTKNRGTNFKFKLEFNAVTQR